MSKTFGSHKALDNISFSVGAGAIFGFLGSSSSGKTTITILSGLLLADSGRSEIFEKPSLKLNAENLTHWYCQ